MGPITSNSFAKVYEKSPNTYVSQSSSGIKFILVTLKFLSSGYSLIFQGKTHNSTKIPLKALWLLR